MISFLKRLFAAPQSADSVSVGNGKSSSGAAYASPTQREDGSTFPSSAMAATSNDEKIIAAIEPWMLACAVGSHNGTVGVHMGFKPWLLRSKVNWMPDVKKATGASESAIEAALYRFVQANGHQHMNEVLRSVEKARGKAPAVVLGPGESMEVEVRVPLQR